jgi:hypothetical protein
VVLLSLHKGALLMSAGFELCEGIVVSAENVELIRLSACLERLGPIWLWDLTMAERGR